jgi:hypothetical protein
VRLVAPPSNGDRLDPRQWEHYVVDLEKQWTVLFNEYLASWAGLAVRSQFAHDNHRCGALTQDRTTFYAATLTRTI